MAVRYRTRLFLLFALVSAAAILGFALPARYFFVRHNTRLSIEKGESIAGLLANRSEELVLRDDPVALLQLCEAARSAHREIAYLFCERDGTVLAGTQPGGVPAGLLALGPVRARSGVDVTPVDDERGHRFYHLRARVGGGLATLHLGLSAEVIRGELAPFDRTMGGVALLLLTVVPLGLSYLVSRNLSRPVEALRQGAERLGQGELGYRLDVRTGDELQALAEAFNAMAASLAVSYESLQEQNAALEIEVEERRQATAQREAMQGQLVQAQKMEAVGVLAGGIAHDFNNLLTAIQGYSDLGMLRVDRGDAVRECLRHISDVAARAAALVRQLLLFSRRQTSRLDRVDVTRRVEGLLPMLERLLGENIRVETRLEPAPWAVLAAPETLDQVVMNLAVNARDAMPDGGVLAFRTDNVLVGEDARAAQGAARTGRFVRLTVADSGVGIPPEVRGRMFDPFFTTKEVGRGTGLGLSVVYGIVDQYGGWIGVESEPGRGATFEVYLPAAPGEEEPSGGPAPPAAGREGTGQRILLVEDDPSVREFTGSALRDGGYRVVEAPDVAGAREAFARHREELSLVFSDVALPDGTGVELLDEFRRECPSLPVVLTSGYADRTSCSDAIAARGVPFLPKPYSLADLLGAVEAALSGGARRP